MPNNRVMSKQQEYLHSLEIEKEKDSLSNNHECYVNVLSLDLLPLF